MGFMDTLALPAAMTRLDQWLCWEVVVRNGKETKVPKDPKNHSAGKADDPSTWSSYEVAKHTAETEDWGLGFVFTEQDDLVGIDLDDMRDPETGQISEKAEKIIDRLDSYTEISPSGEGFHIIVKGEKPSGRSRKGGIEMYGDGRFFTVTGNRLPGTEPEVKKRNTELQVIHSTFLREETSGKVRNSVTNKEPDVDLDNNEILRKAKNSSNGKKFEALWNGITSGYDSHSEADLALCSYLAFWTCGDAKQMDELFRKSGLYRNKWDREHSSDGKTYGELTVQKAIETSDGFYGED